MSSCWWLLGGVEPNICCWNILSRKIKHNHGKRQWCTTFFLPKVMSTLRETNTAMENPWKIHHFGWYLSGFHDYLTLPEWNWHPRISPYFQSKRGPITCYLLKQPVQNLCNHCHAQRLFYDYIWAIFPMSLHSSWHSHLNSLEKHTIKSFQLSWPKRHFNMFDSTKQPRLKIANQRRSHHLGCPRLWLRLRLQLLLLLLLLLLQLHQLLLQPEAVNNVTCMIQSCRHRKNRHYSTPGLRGTAIGSLNATKNLDFD